MSKNWARLEYSRADIDRAGRLLAENDLSPEERANALTVLGNWRAAHAFPLNTMQIGLRRMSTGVTPNAVVAQRLKRVPSMVNKLKRYPAMRLSRMQDIGGARAVVRTPKQVLRIQSAYDASSIRHQRVGTKDYILTPKPSGYRGVHLVYRYESDRNSHYNGLRIEIQLRTQVQHAWATAVETVGTFLNQSLKSSEGEELWLEFFALVSSSFARLEGTPTLASAPSTKRELVRSIRRMTKELDVYDRLDAFRVALQEMRRRERRSDKYFLLSLEPGRLYLHGFRSEELELATERYLELEARPDPADTVLVSADSIRSLELAYPNYFLDTQLFLRTLTRALK